MEEGAQKRARACFAAVWPEDKELGNRRWRWLSFPTQLPRGSSSCWRDAADPGSRVRGCTERARCLQDPPGPLGQAAGSWHPRSSPQIPGPQSPADFSQTQLFSDSQTPWFSPSHAHTIAKGKSTTCHVCALPVSGAGAGSPERRGHSSSTWRGRPRRWLPTLRALTTRLCDSP